MIVLESEVWRRNVENRRIQGLSFRHWWASFFFKSREVEDLWTEILPDDMLVRPRSSRILYRQNFFSSPLKAFEALRKLRIFESLLCVLSYVWARIFPIRPPRNFQE